MLGKPCSIVFRACISIDFKHYCDDLEKRQQIARWVAKHNMHPQLLLPQHPVQTAIVVRSLLVVIYCHAALAPYSSTLADHNKLCTAMD